jgi:hypothetical protein
MHPDYVGYVIQKRKVLPKAKWHDIKFLLRKLLDIEDTELYVQLIEWGNDYGWLVEFSCDVDTYEVKRNISKTCVVGERVVYIGVHYYG